MGKPTETELAIALNKAGEMREHNHDPHFVAKSLLNLNYRMQHLEKVRHYAELYLKSGTGTREHSMLVKSINDYKSLDDGTAGESTTVLGL